MDEEEQLFQMGCGHPFCKECWVQYLEENISSHGKEKITCPEYKCDIVVDEFTIEDLLKAAGQEETLARFYQRVADAIVQRRPTLRWCPSPHCDMVVGASHSKVGVVSCKCEYKFCFQCGEEDHTPLLCGMLKAWIKKCIDDSEVGLNGASVPFIGSFLHPHDACTHSLLHSFPCVLH